MATRRLAKDLPECRGGYDGATVIPFFRPALVPEGDGICYLSEDFSFCHRAALAGFKIIADTTIRVGHIGRHTYTWDDLMPDRVLETLKLTVDASEPAKKIA
jgi:hypothetical protein